MTFLLLFVLSFCACQQEDMLLWGIDTRQADVVEQALEEGCDPNQLVASDITTTGKWEKPPLRLAVDYSTPEICELLIDYGADVNYVDAGGDSLLMATIDNCRLDIAQVLIDKGADVFYCRSDGKDLMDSAIINSISSCDADDNTYDMILLLNSHGLEIKYLDFVVAFENEVEYIVTQEKILDRLFFGYESDEIQVSISEKDLLYTIYQGKTEKVISEFDKYEEMNDIPFYLISYCVAKDNLDVLEYYYENGGDLTRINCIGGGVNLLMVGAAFDAEKSVDFLIAHGVDENLQSEELNTEDYTDNEDMAAIDYAYKYDSKKVLELLEK